MKTLGIYIHIPFCIQKCLYCDFLSFPKGRQEQTLYFDALKKEIETSAEECRDYEVVSVFFGGGTPTSVDPQHIVEIMKILKKFYNLRENAEITIECNPGTADATALREYHEAGINRISMGLQSANDEELKRLGRIHNLRQFEECYKNAREAGFENVNVDLMSALPGQNIEDWENNLKYVCGLNPKPEHISAYSLIIEEGTPFYQIYEGEAAQIEKNGVVITGDNKDEYPPLPDEDSEREMYHRTVEILGTNGYHRYEISNYAMNSEGEAANVGTAGPLDDDGGKYECLHNKRYWQGGDYIGFGLGAASLFDGERFHNTSDFREYLEASGTPEKQDAERLDTVAQMEEFMFLGLRMISGVSAGEFKNKFGQSIEDVYGEIFAELISEDLMVREGDTIRLTDKGLDVSNYCMAKFLI